MILIITHKEDYTADYLITKLNEQRISYYRFNCEDILTIPYKFQNFNEFSAEIASISHFTSVWFRRTKLPDLNTELTPAERTYLLLEYDALLNNVLMSVDSLRWLSNPNSIYKAENKLYQLKVAQVIGFNIPDTLVTNMKDDIVEFARKYDNNVIIKTLNSARIRGDLDNRLVYTSKINRTHIDNIKEFDITPFILQKNIEKQYEIRVTIIDKTVFAAKVNSQGNEATKVDWRREKLLFTEYILPETISLKCVNIVRYLKLSFGAIDLIKSTDGEYYFLEINPNGQWAWIEIDTKQSISNSIINFLTSNA